MVQIFEKTMTEVMFVPGNVGFVRLNLILDCLVDRGASVVSLDKLT